MDSPQQMDVDGESPAQTPQLMDVDGDSPAASQRQPEGESPAQSQIYAFLDISGASYPIKIGSNVIGRDQSKCQIVLGLVTISRQHAMINVFSADEVIITDLDSTNKTKLGLTTLVPHLSRILKDGDTVQFGDVICIFRLCNDLLENDPPMTQVLDMPETLAQRETLTSSSIVSDTPVRPAIEYVEQMTVPEPPECSDVNQHETPATFNTTSNFKMRTPILKLHTCN